MTGAQHPGARLKEELAKVGWSQADLIYVLGCSPKTVNMIVRGKHGISPSMSKALGEVFGLPSDHFADLQTSFDLAGAAPPDPAIGLRARIRKSYPVRTMIKRGWLPEEPDQIERHIAAFFGVDDLNSVPYISHAAKKTSYGDQVSPAQLAWLLRVRQIAKSTFVQPFSIKKLQTTIIDMKEWLIEPEEARHVPRRLQDCGVRFIIVEPLPGSEIDGVCFWLSPSEPVIGMSLKHDRIDNFWFVLRHEIEHVVRGDGKCSEIGMVDAQLDSEDGVQGDRLSEPERIANAAAADFCVSDAKIQSFIRRKNPLFYEKDVIAFSKLNGVHPGITAGQLRHRTGLWAKLAYLRKYQVPIRSFVLPGAIVDGYGQTVPIE